MDNVNAKAIVRALARVENLMIVDTRGLNICGLCKVMLDESDYDQTLPSDDIKFHEVWCAWRLAKEWVAEADAIKEPYIRKYSPDV